MGLEMLIALPSMILVWVAVLAAPLLAVVGLARGVSLLTGRQGPPVTASATICSNCHRSRQPNWQHCAYCGHRLA